MLILISYRLSNHRGLGISLNAGRVCEGLRSKLWVKGFSPKPDTFVREVYVFMVEHL